MQIPKSVKILGLDYEIKEVDCVDAKDEDVIGQINHSTLVISLKSNLPNTQKENTLIHEITHGILENIGESDLNNNEDFVNRFSSVLHQVITVNKSLFL